MHAVTREEVGKALQGNSSLTHQCKIWFNFIIFFSNLVSWVYMYMVHSRCLLNVFKKKCCFFFIRKLQLLLEWINENRDVNILDKFSLNLFGHIENYIHTKDHLQEVSILSESRYFFITEVWRNQKFMSQLF